MRTLCSLFVATLASLVVRVAAPCSPLPCARNGVVPESGVVPENARGLVWALSAPGGATTDVQELVTLTRSATRVPLKSEPRSDRQLWLIPAGGWKAGETYELSIENACPHFLPQRLGGRLRVESPAPPPRRLGALRAHPAARHLLLVATSSGSCSAQLDAVYVDVEVALDASAQPWRDTLFYETYVDNELYVRSSSLGAGPQPGSSWIGRGRDRVYSLCGGDGGGARNVAPGRHRLEIRAKVLGEGEPIAAGPIDIELDCAAFPASQAQAPAFAPLTSATAPSASTSPPNTSPSAAPSVPTTPPAPLERNGCACRASLQGRSRASWLALLVAACMLRRRCLRRCRRLRQS